MLKTARDCAGMTQRQVAAAACIGVQQYQEYEYDKKEPGVRTANRIARAVDSTAEIIWGFGAATPEEHKEA